MSEKNKNFIEELKERSDILEVAKELIPNLKRTGRAWVGTTRNEKTPALTIYPDTQSWTHYAGDTTPRGKNGGDVISLVEYARQCSPRDAMEFLARKLGLEMRRLTSEEQQRVTEERKKADEDAAILERLVSIFEKDSRAAAYLQDRGINSKLAEEYRAGWADHDTKTLRNELRDCSVEPVNTVLKNPSFFRNSLIIPIIKRGRIVSLYSRSEDRETDKRHLYLSGHRKGAFNHDNALLSADKRLYVAEAPIDALSAIQHGVKNIVSFGGCRLSNKQIEWLRGLHDIEIITCFDNDDKDSTNRGYEATKLFMKNFPEAKMKVLSSGDLNDFFREHTQEDFEKLEVKDWYTTLLQEVDPDVPKEGLISVLEPLFIVLALNVDFSTADLFIRHRVKKHFKSTSRDMESCLRRFKEIREEVTQKKIEEERKKDEAVQEEARQMTDEEKAEAEAFLKNSDLIELIREDLTKLGTVGEDKNKVAVYLMCTTRKTARPVNSTVRATSGIGKSNMVFTVLMCMPEEDVVDFTRITSKYLDYVQEDALQYKILSIAERAGTEDADYSIRMVEDDTNPGIKLGYLKKDPKTGEMTAVEKTVRGPTMLIQTTTKLEMNQENESREFPIYLDESEEQRKDVHNFIRNSELPHIALQEEERSAIKNRHQNAQRLLQPITVIVPFSQLIEFPTKRARTSRDLKRFLSFIKVSALLHQYQRPRATIHGKEYVLATLKDYETAYDLLDSILEDALSELNPSSEKLLEVAKEIQNGLGEEDRFTRADLRKEVRWERAKVARAVEPLEAAGYFDVQQIGNAYTYRLIFEDELADIAKETLPPDKFVQKVHTNLDKIDPVYGNEWLDKEPVPVQEKTLTSENKLPDQNSSSAENKDVEPEEEADILKDIQKDLRNNESSENTKNESGKTEPEKTGEEDRMWLADYILVWGEKHNYPKLPVKFNSEGKAYISVEGKDHWYKYMAEHSGAELKEVRQLIDKQNDALDAPI